MSGIQISMESIFWFSIGVIIPVILFAWRLHNLTKHIRDMHLEPEAYGFGTDKTNDLLSQHMNDEMEMHRESLAAVKSLTYTIRELTHYVRWLNSERGESPPPYVRVDPID